LHATTIAEHNLLLRLGYAGHRTEVQSSPLYYSTGAKG
jgi:hypothetical protein